MNDLRILVLLLASLALIESALYKIYPPLAMLAAGIACLALAINLYRISRNRAGGD